MSRIIINKKKITVNLILKKFLFVIILFVILIIFFWFISTTFKIDRFSNYIEYLSKKYDYILTNVEISGLNNVSEDEINQYFEKYNNKSIFFVPINEISKRIEKNNWIESAIVKNNFKNKINIHIKELAPIAIYYNGNNYLFIDKFGKAIDFVNDKETQKYIILAGNNATKHAAMLIEAIPSELLSQFIKAQYINNRRWDIYTKNNLRIKLPENEYKRAMNNLIDIYFDLLSSDITNIEYIDLRISERAIIKLYNNNTNSL